IIGKSKDNIEIVDCINCIFFHQKPIPDALERADYYEKQYFQITKADYFEKQKEDLEYSKIGFSHKEKFLKKCLNSLPMKILDIGAGSALLLKYFHDRGWEVKGIEPNHLICDYVKNEFDIDLISCTFEKFLEINKDKFSVINLSYILEHVINPIWMIEKINDNLLFENGIICIEVPNDFNPLQLIVYSKIDNNWWINKDHINYFTPKTLKILLARTGFEVIHTEVTFPLEFFILMGDNYITSPELGRPSHLRRVEFEKNLELYNKKLKKDLYSKFLELEIGRSIIMYGRRKK
ncbi:MAG: class I SAM-dependent methyltransferase, partial [Promethearchaeota archaeon]